MLGKILGAIAGERLAGRNNKVTGALVGAAVPAADTFLQQWEKPCEHHSRCLRRCFC